MDGIKKLAHKLAGMEPEERPVKAAHTLSLRHHDFLTLQAYCTRKKINVGDVVSELIADLLHELIQTGEITMEDASRADELLAARGTKTKKPPG